jgi:hypothetical protein
MPRQDKQPEKKKKKTRLKKAPVISVGLSGVNLSSVNVEDINQIPIPPDVDEVIKQAFLRFYDVTTLKQNKLKDLEHLSNICEEFLRAYVILGYDLNGEKVHIMHAKNHHDKDALIEHIRSTLIGMLNSGQGS